MYQGVRDRQAVVCDSDRWGNKCKQQAEGLRHPVSLMCLTSRSIFGSGKESQEW